MAKLIERHGVHSVKPQTAGPLWVHPLTNLDLLSSSPGYNEVILFFRGCVTPSYAGRMNIGEDGKVVVNVNSQGINFIESKCDASLDQWPDLRQCPFEINLSLQDGDMNPSIEAGKLDVAQAPPLLQIQVTFFNSGGVALGFHFVHAIMDGFSLVHFLNSWSKVHTGQQIDVLPSFQAEVFKTRNPLVVNSPPPFVVDETAQEDATNFEFDHPNQYESVVLRINKEALQACVREVETGKFSYGKSTSFEAASAMLWSSITRAKRLGEGLDTSYMLPINLRGRYSNVSGAYFGNAYILCQAYSRTAEDIMKDKSYAARLIHDRIRSCNLESVRSAIDWAELQSPAAIFRKLHWKRGLLSTSLGRFPVYDTNFGWSGGSLSQICLLPSALPPQFVATIPAPPSTGEKGLDLHIRLHHAYMDNLLNDGLFTKYFHAKEITMWASPLLRKATKAL